MKYCSKCGNPMEDDMRFCQKCGARAETPLSSPSPARQSPEEPGPVLSASVPTETAQAKPARVENNRTGHARKQKRTRKGMVFFAGFFGFFAFLYLCILFSDPSLLSAVVCFTTLSVLFLVLSRSPKDQPNIFGMEKGCPKKAFVPLALASGMLLSLMLSMAFGTDDAEPVDSEPDTAKTVSSSAQETVPEEGQSLKEVETWYLSQIPAVETALKAYAESVNGATDLRIEETKFYFGESDGWVDCYYKTTFRCHINGADCTGYARAFVKYRQTDIHFFDYEIWRSSDRMTVIEEHDERYDRIMEDYYRQLKAERND